MSEGFDFMASVLAENNIEPPEPAAPAAPAEAEPDTRTEEQKAYDSIVHGGRASSMAANRTGELQEDVEPTEPQEDPYVSELEQAALDQVAINLQGVIKRGQAREQQAVEAAISEYENGAPAEVLAQSLRERLGPRAEAAFLAHWHADESAFLQGQRDPMTADEYFAQRQALEGLQRVLGQSKQQREEAEALATAERLRTAALGEFAASQPDFARHANVVAELMSASGAAQMASTPEEAVAAVEMSLAAARELDRAIQETAAEDAIYHQMVIKGNVGKYGWKPPEQYPGDSFEERVAAKLNMAAATNSLPSEAEKLAAHHERMLSSTRASQEFARMVHRIADPIPRSVRNSPAKLAQWERETGRKAPPLLGKHWRGEE